MNVHIKFRELIEKDIPIIVDAFAVIGWDKPASLYEKYLHEQDNGLRCVWVGFKDDTFLGYVTLKWQSDYPSFAMQSIPEINDLNVLPVFRNQGIGSQLLDLAEAEAQTRSNIVGLGVGLYADYGNAQKMYVKRNYIPDGNGVTYNYQLVVPEKKYSVDDDLILWFIKKLI